MGNWKILKYSGTSYLDLVHETASRIEIKESDFISAMDWFGRVNFSIRSHGGYCMQVDCLVTQGQYVVSDSLCPALHDCDFA